LGAVRPPGERKEEAMKTAVAYITDDILCPEEGKISKDLQKERILKYAEENGIRIERWVEDEQCTADPLDRPGVLDILYGRGDFDFDLVLVERVGTLSRRGGALGRLFREMDLVGMKLEAATMLFDLPSQIMRRHFNPEMATPPVQKRLHGKRQKEIVSVRKPERFPASAPTYVPLS